MAATALAIKLRCASWAQLAQTYQRDLRQARMFLKSQNPPGLGTEIRIDMTIPSGSVITVNGRVARHVPPTGRGPGIELVLTPLTNSAQWVIEKALTAAGVPFERAEERASVAMPAAPAPSPADRQRLPSVEIPVEVDTSGTEDQPVGEPENEQEAAGAEFDLVQALEAELTALKKINPFQVLGVSYSANDEQIRAQFAELTKRYHPDRFARYESERARALASEIFILVREAYRRIGDPTARARTRATLQSQAQAQPQPPPAPPVAERQRSISPPPPAATVAAKPAAKPATPVPATPAKPVAAPPRAAAPPPPSPPAALPLPAPPPPDFAPERVVTLRSPPGAPPVAQALSNDALFGDLDDNMRPTAAPTEAIQLSQAPGHADAERLLDAGRYEEAYRAFDAQARVNPTDRPPRVGRELACGFIQLAAGDKGGAAQHFEAALEIDPMNERAARELAAMRRAATESRKGLLGKLLGRKP